MGFRGGKTGRNWNDDRDETALFAGGYKEKCNSCGEWGHKARDCRLKEKEDSRNNKNEFRWKCYNCNERGHKAKDCPKKKEKKDQANVANNNEEVDIAFMTQEMKGKEKTKNLFIADSGASCHLVGNDEGMYECEHIDDDIVIGDGKSIRATKIGKFKMLLKQQDGSENRSEVCTEFGTV